MKNILFTLILLCCAQFSAYAFDHENTKQTKPGEEKAVPEVYLQYSEFTDPGEYVYLYDNLPDSLPDLCRLIRSQFIHAYAELNHYREQIPKERWGESSNYPNVQSILAGLLSLDSSGIVYDRKPEDRLVLICRHNAILLASVLKHRGIPARVRYGHATYLIPDFHTSHAICEVWNDSEGRWMLVDPSTLMIDFDRAQFDISNEAWLQFQNGEIDPNLYGIPGRYSGMGSILAKLCADLCCILGTEYTVTQYPPVLEYLFEDKAIPVDLIDQLNAISELMKTIDAETLSELQDIYDNTPEIQMTQSLSGR